MRAVRGTLAVDVVLVQLEPRRTRHAGCVPRSRFHDAFAGLVPDHGVERVGDLGRRILRMGVIDVQPCPVGENHVRGADLVRVDHRRGTAHSPQIEASGISQRRFDLVIPACALGPWHARCGGVGKHRLG